MNIIVLAGQSNMAGRGNVSALPRYLNKVHSDIWYHYYCGFAADKTKPYSSDGWTFLQPGKKHVSTPEAHFGPEMSFAVAFKEALSLTDGELGIIKVAVGGTNLVNDWNPVSPGGHKIFPNFVKRVNTALLSSVKSSANNIKGILWMQGEGDSLDKESAIIYRHNLEIFIKNCRSFFNNSKLPFIQGQIMDRNTDRMPFAAMVREAQHDVCNTFPNIGLIETDDLADMGDKIHFSSEALIELGKRYAQALVNMRPSLQI